MSLGLPIVFFDGYCHLCNESVRILLSLDRHERLRYAPLQGETARGVLPTEAASEDSIVYFDGMQYYVAYRALLGIAELLWPQGRLVWRFLSFRPLVWVGEGMYRLIARLRYRIFGRTEYCSIGRFSSRDSFLS